MLVQRRRRCTNIRPALGQRLLFAGHGALSLACEMISEFQNRCWFRTERLDLKLDLVKPTDSHTKYGISKSGTVERI